MVIKGRRGVIVSDCWVSQILFGVRRILRQQGGTRGLISNVVLAE